MIRQFSILVLLLSFPLFFCAQNTISVKKQNSIEGLYQIEKGANLTEYIFFDKENTVVILHKPYRKKKAMGAIQDCIINDNCNSCKKMTYSIEKNNTIVFGFKKSTKGPTQFTEYRAKLNDDKSVLTVKISKTDTPVEVKNYVLK